MSNANPKTPNQPNTTKETSETPKLTNRKLVLRSNSSPLSSLGESPQVGGKLTSSGAMATTPEADEHSKAVTTPNSGVDEEVKDDATNDDQTRNTIDTMEVENEDDDDGTIVPRYCNAKHIRSALQSFTLDLKNVISEIQETGDGGDSDIEGELAAELDEGVEEATLETGTRKEDEDVALLTDKNVTFLDVNDLSRFDTDEKLSSYIPTPPVDWLPPISKNNLGEPSFDKVDNPGGWNNFCFRPEFDSKAKGERYVSHSLPTGARPVPVDLITGERIIDGWKFHYDGKFDSTTNSRKVSVEEEDSDDLFPASRKGYLDKDKLENLGLTKNRMKMKDALFFYQLLLPICDPRKSGVKNDPRTSFYSEVTNYSNFYACQIGLLGGQYSHAFKPIKVQELLHFDGVVVRDGVLGGSNGALYRRWMNGETMYDSVIHDSISHDRFLQIKRTIKLCNNYEAKRKGELGYEPAYKYDLIFKALVANCNALTKKADLDLCGDETTFAHMGYGESDTGLLKRLGQQKPGVTRGMQTVMLFDVNRIRPRAYLHRHRHHPNQLKMSQGQNEAKILLESLMPMIEGFDGRNGIDKIFSVPPHSTWDNYFSGDDIMNWMGRNGFSAITTCRRDRLPKGVPGHYWHKKKVIVDKRTRCARFLEPIVASKRFTYSKQNTSPSTITSTTPVSLTGDAIMDDTEKLQYQRVHVSFQSTSSCNFSTVNSLSRCSLSVRKKERGQKNNKRKWVIEMNEARALYLATYGIIDNVDKLIKFSRMSYCSWKYWHAAMLHAKAMTVVVAYDMYREVSEGNLNPSWKIQKPMSYWEFRDRLGIQMLHYDPKYCIYPGDERMRPYTALNKVQRKKSQEKVPDGTPSSSAKKRSRSERMPTVEEDQDEVTSEEEDDFVPPTLENMCTEDQFKRVKKQKNSRLCGNLNCIIHHISFLKKIKCAKPCVVCGVDSYTSCSLCPGNPGLHFYPTKGVAKGKHCFLTYHSNDFFGLARDDTSLFHGRRFKDWKPPNTRMCKANAKHIATIEENLKNKKK